MSSAAATAKFTSPFPPLELSSGDEARLEEMAYFLVQSTVLEYQEYLYKDERIVDHDQWKFMKRKQKVRVYVERSEKEKRKRRRRKQEEESEGSSSSCCCLTSEVESFSPESTWSSVADERARAPGTTIGTTEEHNARRKARSSLGSPAFLVAGSIEGTLEDAMYGVLSPTVDAMRIKSSYVRDKIVNAAVLATIISPTVENPFRSLSVKWIEKRQPMHLDALVKNHDVVILESTGITCLTNGERIGYVLLHSVQFPETLPLDSVIRGGLSICMLFREDTTASVDVFLIGNVGPVQGATRLLVVKSAVEGLISVWKLVECARMKKLTWALSQQHSCSIDQIAGKEEEEVSRLSEGDARPSCTHCKRRSASISRWRRYFTRGRTTKTTATCTLCSEYVCSSCKVKQKLSYLVPDSNRGHCRQREFTFCALCIHVAVMRTNSLAVATEEAHAMARNSAGHKSLITAWLRGMLDQPLFRYTRTQS